MALVVYDRVQETTATTGTGTITLSGAVAGYQSFAVVGNGNTTFYCIVNSSAWEVGIGTYTSVGTTLARTTVLSNSNGTTSPITLVGASTVFVTYPAGKSVNLDSSGNVGPLGTIASGVWNGTTIGVAYGGTGVTSSSGANSVMLRDANQNVSINRLNQSSTAVTAAGTTTTLTAASTFSQILNGTGGQTFKLPDATTLTNTTTFEFNNNATGTLTIVDNASGAVGTIASGGAAAIALLSNGTVGGTWDVHAYIPENVQWGTNSLALSSTVITGGTWNGGAITPAYGGTGLTTFTAANYALYSTSASALTAGTLPVAAGGTGATTFTSNGVLYGTGTTAIGVTAAGTTGQVLTATTSGAPTWANPATSGTVTSVAQSFTGGLISVGGSPITSSGTLALTVAGTSGGIPYFSSATTWATSAALAANALVIGGGAGVAPSTTTTGTGVVTALGVNTGTAGAFVVNGGALGTPSSGTLTNCTFPTLNQNTTGTASNVTGTVAVANGGTGVSTLTGIAKGNGTSAFTAATSGTDYSAGTSALGTGILKSTTTTGALTIAVAADFPTLNQNTSGTAAGLSATLVVGSGGTGTTTAPTAGAVVYGASTSAQGYTAVGTSGQVLISGAAGSPTWTTNIAGNAANVTGTVAVGNGGTGGTTAAAGRTGLGATTVGSNMFTLTNPSAVTFPQFNADNTVSALSAASFRSAIGAGTGSGTVTSVGGTGTVSGLSLSGTVTSSGNLTLGGTLAVTSANMPAGSIIQVSQATQTAAFTTSSTSYVDFTGLSVTITPRNSSSRFLIQFTSGFGNDTSNGFQYARLVRGSTAISIGDASGSVTQASVDGGYGTVGAYDISLRQAAVNYVDSPATASSVTYKVQVIRTLSGTSYWGRTANTSDANRSAISSNLIVMEIAG